MSEDMVWNFFERTGSIETFLEYTKIKELKDSDEGFYNIRNDN